MKNNFKYDGNWHRLLNIWLHANIMRILTLGFYTFWGRTRIRSYILHSFSLQSDRFEYLGSAKELLKGFLIAFPVWVISIVALFRAEDSPYVDLIAIALFLLFYFLFFAASYNSFKYRMNRIAWRGIRGHLSGSATKYGLYAIWYALFDILTLGLAMGWTDHKMYKYRTNKLTFGNIPVRYIGEGIELFKPNLISIVFIPVTFGLSRIYYRARKHRYLYSNTFIGPFRLHNDESTRSLLILYFKTTLIIGLSFGLLYPLALHLNMKYMAKHFSLSGDLNTDAVKQAAEFEKTSGEGLSSLLGNSGMF